MGAYVDSLQERASSSATFRPASASSQASERNSSSDWFDELYTVTIAGFDRIERGCTLHSFRGLGLNED